MTTNALIIFDTNNKHSHTLMFHAHLHRSTSVLSNWKLTVLLSQCVDYVGCSHMRALELYVASLNPHCTFTTLACDNLQDALQVGIF